MSKKTKYTEDQIEAFSNMFYYLDMGAVNRLDESDIKHLPEELAEKARTAMKLSKELEDNRDPVYNFLDDLRLEGVFEG